MTRNQRIEKLKQAQEDIRDAIRNIRAATRGLGIESAADAYIIPHLRNWAEGENPYDHTAIPRLIENIKKDGISIDENDEFEEEEFEEDE